MTNGADSNNRLDRIEAAILALANAQQRTQEQLDREMAAIADLRAAQVITNQNFEMIGELIADNSRQIGELTQRAEQDRAEIRRIWEYLREGRNGHSNGNGGEG